MKAHPDGEPVRRCELPDATLVLGVDGRIYCQDLTPELADLLSAICPQDAALAARLEILQARQQEVS